MASTAAPPASNDRMDFRMKTAALSPRVMAPVWDRRVIAPRSGGVTEGEIEGRSFINLC